MEAGGLNLGPRVKACKGKRCLIIVPSRLNAKHAYPRGIPERQDGQAEEEKPVLSAVAPGGDDGHRENC